MRESREGKLRDKVVKENMICREKKYNKKLESKRSESKERKQ